MAPAATCAAVAPSPGRLPVVGDPEGAGLRSGVTAVALGSGVGEGGGGVKDVDADARGVGVGATSDGEVVPAGSEGAGEKDGVGEGATGLGETQFGSMSKRNDRCST